MSRHQIVYNKQVIQFELKRKRVKNINLRVHADLRVTVSAGPKVPLKEIKAFVHSKANWILRHLAQYQAEQKKGIALPGQQLKTGAKIMHLGESLTIDVVSSDYPGVEQQADRLVIFVNDINHEQNKLMLLHRWQATQAEPIFIKAIHDAQAMLVDYQLPFPHITIRKMKTRWGSCSPTRQRVSLNLHLIQTPLCCIEYVALHEMAHFIHPNHSSAFYQCLAQVMPDWAVRRNILKALAYLTRQ